MSYQPVASVKVYRGTSLTFGSNSTTVVGWDQEEFDSAAFHDNTVNNTRLTVPAGLGGLYQIGAAIRTTAVPTSRLLTQILVNGSGVRGGISEVAGSIASGSTTAVGFTTVPVLVPVNLVPGDYVECSVFNAGSARDLDLTMAALWMTR